MSNTDEFPLDYTEWKPLWYRWIERQIKAGVAQRTGYRFPRKSLMADDILGIWRIGDHNVELSDVTFIGTRGVGITFGEASGTWVPDNGVAHSFAELEATLAAECGVEFASDE